MLTLNFQRVFIYFSVNILGHTHLLAHGNIIPKINNPSRGPPIIPNNERAAWKVKQKHMNAYFLSININYEQYLQHASVNFSE